MDGQCVSAGGIGPVPDPDCATCTRVVDVATCGKDRPVHWQCLNGFPGANVIDSCTDRATALPRYCCPDDFGKHCGDF